MKRSSLLLLSVLLVFPLLSRAQTYGNWSGLLHTQSVPVTDNGNPDFRYFTPQTQKYLKENYKGKYIKVITYVVRQGERYTVSIKYPRNGVGYGMEFIGYDPYRSRGFSVTYQNKNLPGKWWVERVNFTNDVNSTSDRTLVVVATDTPSAPFYLRIQYPAVPDNVVDSRLPNPADPQAGEFFWGTVKKTPILMMK